MSNFKPPRNSNEVPTKYKVLLVLLAIYLLPLTVYAQQIREEKIIGSWEGPMVTELEGQQFETVVRFEFSRDKKVKLTMSGTQVASYEINENWINIIFNNNLNEPLVLSNIRVSDKAMWANARFSSDPPSMSSYVLLSKLDSCSIPSKALIEGSCNDLNIPSGIKGIFNKYELRCPVDIEENAKWYNFDWFSKFLSEVIQNSISPGSKSSPITPHIYGYAQRISVIVSNKDEEEKVNRILASLKPYFKDIDKINVDYGMAVGERVSANIVSGAQVKPNFLSGSNINYDRVWNEIINAAVPLGIRLDTKTEVRNGNDRSIKQSVPRKIAESQGFFYFEKVNISMKDPNRDGKNVLIEINSEIYKRKGYSNFRQTVECSLNQFGESGSSNVVCSEAPYLRAVVYAVTGKER